MVTEDTASAVPSRALARLAPHLPVDDVRIEPLGAGDHFRAYAISDRWVVRVARHESAAAALEREAILLPLLAAKLPLGIPRPMLHYPGAYDEAAFEVHRIVPGPALSRADYEALPPCARDRCAHAVGEFLGALHRTDVALARACGVPAHDYAERYPAMLAASNASVPPFLHALIEAHRHGQYQPVLLHGDLSPDHVMWDPRSQTVTGIIDFGDMAIGDPAWDFVYLCEDYGADFVTRALATYPCDDPRSLLRRMRGLQMIETVSWVARTSSTHPVGYPASRSSSATE